MVKLRPGFNSLKNFTILFSLKGLYIGKSISASL